MMNKFVLTTLACAIGAVACSHLREPSDTQLATLLRSERAQPTDANALLDASAIDCLRAWSGDAELAKNLAPRFATEEGKKGCRAQLDTWIVDPARNPDKFAFADISASKTVHRAIDLQTARRTAMLANPASHQIPAALIRPAAPQAPRAPDPTVDLGAAGMELKDAETLCQQTQQAAATAGASPGLTGYARYCSGNLRQLRTSMEQAAHSGQSSARLDALAKSATTMANIARKQLADAERK
jgi:hypothetical protein